MPTESHSRLVVVGAALIATAMAVNGQPAVDGQPVQAMDTFDTPSPFESGKLKAPPETRDVDTSAMNHGGNSGTLKDEHDEMVANKRSLVRRKGGSPIRCWS